MTKTKYDNVYVLGEHVYRIIRNEYHQMNQWVDNVGYYQVVFRIDGKRKFVRVHRLIAETMIPNPNGYKEVNHIDGNKLNNELSNLEWCNNSYNTQAGYDNGLYHSHHRKHKIQAIDKTTGQKHIFDSIRSCASELGLNRKTITSILKHVKTTNNYPYDFEYVEPVSTIPDECKGVGSEISTEPKRKAA